MADILVSPSCLDLFHEQIKRHTSVKLYIPSCFVNGGMYKLRNLPSLEMISELCQFQCRGCVITCGVAFQKVGYRFSGLVRKCGAILNLWCILVKHLELIARCLGNG